MRQVISVLVNAVGLMLSFIVFRTRVSFSFSYAMYLEENELQATDILDGALLADVRMLNLEIILIAIIGFIFAGHLISHIVNFYRSKIS